MILSFNDCVVFNDGLHVWPIFLASHHCAYEMVNYVGTW